MIDYVVDATVVARCNGNLAGRRAGNVLDRRLSLLEDVLGRTDRRLRYNPKLLYEYLRIVRECRNDVLDLFIRYLDSDRPVRVRRNTLARSDWLLAKGARWPKHDEHLLAAAFGGLHPRLYVTESRHAECAGEIKRELGISVQLVA